MQARAILFEFTPLAFTLRATLQSHVARYVLETGLPDRAMRGHFK